MGLNSNVSFRRSMPISDGRPAPAVAQPGRFAPTPLSLERDNGVS